MGERGGLRNVLGREEEGKERKWESVGMMLRKRKGERDEMKGRGTKRVNNREGKTWRR